MLELDLYQDVEMGLAVDRKKVKNMIEREQIFDSWLESMIK